MQSVRVTRLLTTYFLLMFVWIAAAPSHAQTAADKAKAAAGKAKADATKAAKDATKAAAKTAKTAVDKAKAGATDAAKTAADKVKAGAAAAGAAAAGAATGTTAPKTGNPGAPPADGSKPDSAITDRQRFKLVQLEEETNSLKEKIFRSKAQLLLLQESLLAGAISTAKLELFFSNQMGGSFYLKEISFALDGTPIYNKNDYNGSLNKTKKFEIYQGSVQPKQHTLSIMLKYQGNGFGVFSYLNRYKFTIKSSYPFKAQERKKIEIRVVSFEKNWLTTRLKDRPTIRYEMKIRKLTVARSKLGKK